MASSKLRVLPSLAAWSQARLLHRVRAGSKNVSSSLACTGSSVWSQRCSAAAPTSAAGLVVAVEYRDGGQAAEAFEHHWQHDHFASLSFGTCLKRRRSERYDKRMDDVNALSCGSQA